MIHGSELLNGCSRVGGDYWWLPSVMIIIGVKFTRLSPGSSKSLNKFQCLVYHFLSLNMCPMWWLSVRKCDTGEYERKGWTLKRVWNDGENERVVLGMSWVFWRQKFIGSDGVYRLRLLLWGIIDVDLHEIGRRWKGDVPKTHCESVED